MRGEPASINEYLRLLRGQVPLVDAWWQRALSEVEDHLRTAASSMEDVRREDAEAQAVQRFGSPAYVMGMLGAEYA